MELSLSMVNLGSARIKLLAALKCSFVAVISIQNLPDKERCLVQRRRDPGKGGGVSVNLLQLNRKTDTLPFPHNLAERHGMRNHKSAHFRVIFLYQR